jgi:isocitrate dehydrogenase
MAYQHVQFPEGGERIRVENDRLQVPDNPILGFIEGDGTGHDIMNPCRRIWDAAVEKAYGGERKIHWARLFLGEEASELYDGDYFPGETLDAIRELIVAIKGPLTTPVGEGFRSLNVALRQELDLYACVRPVRHYEGVPSPLKEPEKVDVVIFRENTEDVYSGIEFQSGSEDAEKLADFLRNEMGAQFFDNPGLGVKPISAYATKRLVRKAIQFALDNGRESVTLVHKGNIMKFTEGAFRGWGYELAREEFGDTIITEDELYSEYNGRQPEDKIVVKDRIADIMFQLMQLRPEDFGVIATMNLNGDYLSDAVAAEVGGIGIAPGANMSDNIAVFEATHGTAPKHAGKDEVNPGSLLFSGVMMLEYIGWQEAADLITLAYPEVLADKIVTYDFARNMEGATEVKTSEFADALIAQIQGGVDLEKRRAQRRERMTKERKQREIRRLLEPLEEMIATGRTPHTVGDVMTRNLMTVGDDSSIEDAMHLMREHDVSSVVVEPDGQGQWGILTRRDIVNRVVRDNQSPANVKVVNFATRPVVTVTPDADLHDAAGTLSDKGISRLLVEQNEQIIGIVTETDIFQTVEQFGWTAE